MLTKITRCEKHHIFQVYGKGKKYYGYATKLFILQNELRKLKTKKKSIVMFSDAHDVLVFQGENDIKDKFKKFDAKIVFGAEFLCMPDPKLSFKYPPLSKENENGD